MEKAASSAVKGAPFWKVTPERVSKVQVRGRVRSQPVASRGCNSPVVGSRSTSGPVLSDRTTPVPVPVREASQGSGVVGPWVSTTRRVLPSARPVSPPALPATAHPPDISTEPASSIAVVVRGAARGRGGGWSRRRTSSSACLRGEC
ncbi:hypothetical protein GCM10010145_52960 [Streptomyces ruber]|uniref:Uncharacterized protein n=2 Tax=Streptomyces TaxID=1883 RepID=A0A918BKQ9_9ACTN|nr:hypothetical protein GCM10010145_52960 [Streptomyces ruber]